MALLLNKTASVAKPAVSTRRSAPRVVVCKASKSNTEAEMVSGSGGQMGAGVRKRDAQRSHKVRAVLQASSREPAMPITSSLTDPILPRPALGCSRASLAVLPWACSRVLLLWPPAQLPPSLPTVTPPTYSARSPTSQVRRNRVNGSRKRRDHTGERLHPKHGNGSETMASLLKMWISATLVILQAAVMHRSVQQ